ncbi:hypothetical protein LIER_15009 [Lithospermum erythrorhizon]|uniref:RNase H type-1 domain-containing protein n=1 Tax=Lithospermum erythrorhizon TaxID=34254 RepID=A0AAV3Q3H2_LITER
MCTDFTNLNKACPKYFYPLPCLGRLVDGSTGHEVFDFMDASWGYHQIRMAPEDEEKTSFITEYGLYYWRVMPFGLKNTGATYQRIVNDIFAKQIGRNMEIYVDDMLIKRDQLQLYLAISDVAVSSVLIREVDRVQRPIYYVSHVLKDVEERYPVIDKANFALVVSARKLKAYFESHPVQVVTNQPLKRVLTSPALSRRLTSWAVELSEFEISCIPRTSVRAKALADFITECTARNPQIIQGPDTSDADQAKPERTLFVDGARNGQATGAGVLIVGPQEETMEYALRFGFPATNNEAEYEAMILGLRLVRSMGFEEFLVKGDSKLVIDQIKGSCGVKNESLRKYHSKVVQLVFETVVLDLSGLHAIFGQFSFTEVLDYGRSPIVYHGTHDSLYPFLLLSGLITNLNIHSLG